MAEGTVTEPTGADPRAEEDMELVDVPAAGQEPKRPREQEEEEEGEGEEEEEEDAPNKKQKVDDGDYKSAEEERLESVKEGGEREEEDTEAEKSGPVGLGPKTFGSSVEMFDYFYGLLHFWPPNININKYEYLVLLDLLKKGHAESERKIGVGIKTFQVRYHPMWKSRCFFLIRDDDTTDDFSFRKCVDHILPLPENMKIKPDANKALARGKGSGGRGGGGRGGRGRGRGGKPRR